MTGLALEQGALGVRSREVQLDANGGQGKDVS